MAFEQRFDGAPLPSDHVDAYRAAWVRLSQPGTWWNAAERVALAEASRTARGCDLCARRKQALSPSSVDGEHTGSAGSVLPPVAIDLAHRITTDPQRLTKTAYEKTLAAGLGPELYAEAVGVVVQLISIDCFFEVLGLELEALPTPQPGEPSRVRPTGVAQGDAWLPWIDPKQAGPDSLGIYEGLPQVPNVIRALSLVPAEVKGWRAISATQYLPPDQMMSFDNEGPLDRAQIELIAGRVSALGECFY